MCVCPYTHSSQVNQLAFGKQSDKMWSTTAYANSMCALVCSGGYRNSERRVPPPLFVKLRPFSLILSSPTCQSMLRHAKGEVITIPILRFVWSTSDVIEVSKFSHSFVLQ